MPFSLPYMRNDALFARSQHQKYALKKSYSFSLLLLLLLIFSINGSAYSYPNDETNPSPETLGLGVEIKSYNSLISPERCQAATSRFNDLGTYKANLIALNIQKQDLQTSLDQAENLVAAIKDVIDLSQSSLNIKNLELADLQAQLQQLLTQKEAARLAYLQCMNTHAKEECNVERINYLKAKNEYSQMSGVTIPEKENEIFLLEYQISTKQADLKTEEENVQALKDSLQQNSQTQKTTFTLMQDILSELAEIKAYVELNLYSKTYDLILPQSPIKQMRIQTAKSNLNLSGYGKPLGILMPEAGMPQQNIHQNVDWYDIWDLMTAPQDQTEYYKQLLNVHQSIASAMDMIYACDYDSQQALSNDLQNFNPYLVLTLSHAQMLQNTYQVTINPLALLQALTEKSNAFGYLTVADLASLQGQTIPGIQIEVLSEVDEIETAALNPVLKQEFLHRFLLTVARQSPKAFDANCHPNNIMCQTMGWWLPHVDSPVISKTLEELGVENTQWNTLLSNTIYLNKYLVQPLTANAPYPPECPEGQVLENGICVDQPPTECPEGQVLENGVCVDQPPRECPEGQVLENGVCVDQSPTECPEGQVLENGVCVDQSPTECPEGQVLENGVCVDQMPTECPEGQVLENGVCVNQPPTECPEGQVLENGICVNQPPTECPAGQELQNGLCVVIQTDCPDGQILIEGMCI